MTASPDVACFLPRAWVVVAVLVVAGVAAVGGEGYTEEGRSGLSLAAAVGRTGASLYHSTMHYLMDQLAPADPPVDRVDRWARPRRKKHPRHPVPQRSVALEHHECLGAVYRRTGGGSQCVGAVTAALVVGVALLVQAMFYVAVGTACPSLGSALSGARNVTSVVNIAVTNGVDLEALQEEMTQMQTQELEQTQDQDLTQGIDQDVINAPNTNLVQSLTQNQDLNQDQTFNGRALALAMAIARAWPDLWRGSGTLARTWPELWQDGGTLARAWPELWQGGGTLGRAWPLPYFNLCPVFALYLTR